MMNSIARNWLVFSFCTAAFVLTPGVETSSSADQLYDVTINGFMEFNQINAPPLGNVMTGETVTLSFQLDSGNFVDSMSFPTRGYVIDQSSFVLDFSGGTSIGLENPFPMGETPYFVIRDNDPAVDGFFLSNGTDFPSSLPLDQTGLIEQFGNNFAVSYTGDTLSSLDIADAEGFYDFDGLKSFNWTITDGPFDAAGLVFSDLTITRVPEPMALLPLICAGTLVLVKRNRR